MLHTTAMKNLLIALPILLLFFTFKIDILTATAIKYTVLSNKIFKYVHRKVYLLSKYQGLFGKFTQ
ncbi:MAG: hypothetical protein WA959_19205, partial [Rivularia sp. (in: cyanobacteria)]